MYHLLILNVVSEACVSSIYICTGNLIAFNSFFVLYLMCCFGNNPLYMDFTPIKIMFCSVLLYGLCYHHENVEINKTDTNTKK